MNKIFFIWLILLLASCGGIKDTLTLKKKPAGDEFLVEKKSPLVVPPDFGKLPKPINDQEIEVKNDDESEIKKLISNNENVSEENNKSQSALEKTILEKVQ